MSSIENQPYNVPPAAGAAANATFSWLGLAGTFLVFLLILVFTLWLIRRLNRAAVRGINTPWVRVLDRQVLAGQQNLFLVEIAGKLQVLGGSDHHLVKISEIEDPELAADILEEIANRPPAKAEGTLAKVMQKMGRRNHRSPSFSSELERLLEEVEK